MTALLQAKGLTKRFGAVVALDAIDFEIGEGVTGLLGSNGAGKSTAIKLFFGLLRPTSGSAEVLGQDAATTPETRARLGYMPEHECLPPGVSGAEFLTHMAEVSGLPPSQARSRAADTLRHVGLFEERYRPISGYSTGMRQRVKLAQALVHDPVLVMLDEPTAGLDPTGREEMLDLIRRIRTEFGISVILSSHLMGDVERTCDRIVVLEAGRVVEEGEVKAFTRETETLFIEVDERPSALLEALHRRGVAGRMEGQSVVVENVGDATYDVIRDAIADERLPLRRMTPSRRTLTEIFQRARA
jgi:ABC-2 type transport system ATP-binding protein